MTNRATRPGIGGVDVLRARRRLTLHHANRVVWPPSPVPAAGITATSLPKADVT